MSDDKKKNVSRETLPSCVAFGLRYWKRVRAKLDKIGCDWMTPKIQRDWFLAGLAYDLLHGLVDDDDEQCYDYKLFILLGYKLIDLVSSVNYWLINLDFDKDKEN